MIKDILKENDNVEVNATTLEILHTHFPQCFNNEGLFDIERFQTLIKTNVDVTHEGYDLNFLGKTYAKLLASIETTTVIQPDLEHNSKPENINSQNLYISGDNLDGLKHLLKSYTGAVKCIYIDPPYNTGTDGFVYNDKFNFTAEELTNKLSINDEQAQKILDLTHRGSASHSAWLTFMYPRLLLARDLLAHDGVIFISIDDNENANLQILCDTVFGEENRVGVITWAKKRKGSFLSKQLISLTEYVLCYTSNNAFKPYLYGGVADETESQPIIKRTNNVSTLIIPKGTITTKLNDGLYRKGIYGGDVNPVELLDDITFLNNKNTTEFKIKAPFIWSQDFLTDELIKGTELVINTMNFQIRAFRKYEDDAHKGFGSFVDGVKIKGTNEDAYEELEELFDEKNIFDYSKPKNLIKELIKAATEFNKDSTIVDFFSGSGTTGHSVLQLNAEEVFSKRKFILIQLPENLDDKINRSSAIDKGKIQKIINLLDANSYPHSLDYIGIERIKRAAAKIKAETNAVIDYGFKHYTLSEPPIDTLDKLEEFKPDKLYTNNDVLNLFGKDTVLETWLVKDGYGFGAKSHEIKLANYTAYLSGKHLYFIESGLTENDMVALLDKYQKEPSFCPEHIVVFGYSFNFSQTEMLRKNLYILRDTHKNLKANFDIRF